MFAWREYQGVDRDEVETEHSDIVKCLECQGVFTQMNWLEIDESI